MTQPPEQPNSSAASQPGSGVLLPPNFVFGAVHSDFEPEGGGLGPRAEVAVPEPPAPTIPDGPLKRFTDLLGVNGITFAGNGFNTIFRPHSSSSTAPRDPNADVGDNVLELNLTTETQTFTAIQGKVPNRGMVQGDINLIGMTYLQTVFDVTKPGTPTGIHVEPGIWMAVPATDDPSLAQTVVRMASIPHGTTIAAQGDFRDDPGPPGIIPTIDITPIDNSNGQPVPKGTFQSMNASTPNNARIPVDLGPYIAAGTITADILADPNTFLRNHIKSQKISATTTVSISTNPTKPVFGGGADNIAFLLEATGPAATPNAQTTHVEATFWIEIVEYTVEVEPVWPGPVLLHPQETLAPGQPAPTFLVNPPPTITAPRTITVPSIQIQYSQQVFLNFNRLTWPHVSVATLVPRDPINVSLT
jgi:hypothetical protein